VAAGGAVAVWSWLRATMPPATRAPVRAQTTTPARNRRPGPAAPTRGREVGAAGGTGGWGGGKAGGGSWGGAGGVTGGPHVKSGPVSPALGCSAGHSVEGVSATAVSSCRAGVGSPPALLLQCRETRPKHRGNQGK